MDQRQHVTECRREALEYLTTLLGTRRLAREFIKDKFIFTPLGGEQILDYINTRERDISVLENILVAMGYVGGREESRKIINDYNHGRVMAATGVPYRNITDYIVARYPGGDHGGAGSRRTIR